jgi:hypothetical protein
VPNSEQEAVCLDANAQADVERFTAVWWETRLAPGVVHSEVPTMTSTLDQRINALRPGQEIRISPGDTTIWVTAERSGDGKWVRFVRHTLNGFTVIRTARF